MKSKDVRTGIDGMQEVLEGVQEGESVVTGIFAGEGCRGKFCLVMTGARPQHLMTN